MLQPHQIEVQDAEGKTRVYILSKFPALAGREIVAKYPLSLMPKLGDYAVNEETMLKLMAYVAVPVEGKDLPLRLTTRALVDNHIPDWETLVRVEVAMMEYNVSFFGNGKASSFLELITQKAQQLLSRTLTDLSEQSSRKGAQPSTS